jgi:hypothetical protein
MHTCRGGGAFAHIKIGRGAAGYDTCVRGYVRRGGGIPRRRWSGQVDAGIIDAYRTAWICTPYTSIAEPLQLPAEAPSLSIQCAGSEYLKILWAPLKRLIKKSSNKKTHELKRHTLQIL